MKGHKRMEKKLERKRSEIMERSEIMLISPIVYIVSFITAIYTIVSQSPLRCWEDLTLKKSQPLYQLPVTFCTMIPEQSLKYR